MSTTRIRYLKGDNGVLTSRRPLDLADGRTVLVTIDTNTKSYQIKDAVTGSVVMQGENVSKNLNVTKEITKLALKSLGVQFAEENRAEKRRNASDQ